MQRRRFWRIGVVGVVRMVALARYVDRAVLEPILVGNVVDHWAFWHLETRIVLRKDVPEKLHRLRKIGRAQVLTADDQNRVINKNAVQVHPDSLIDGPPEIDAADLGAG